MWGTSSHDDELTGKLAHELDAISSTKDPFSDEQLQADVLFLERLHVVAGPQSKWARRRPISLAELVYEPWLLPPPNTLPRSLIEDAFQACGLPSPRASVVSLSVNLTSSLLLTGRYLYVTPGSVLRYGVLRLATKVLPVAFPNEAKPIAIITLKHRTLSPMARLFIDTAHESRSRWRNGSIALDGGKYHLRLEGRCAVPARSSRHGFS